MTSCKCHKLQEGYFSVQGRFYANSYSEKSDHKLPSGQLRKASGHSSVSNICPDDVVIPSGCPSVSRNFELFKVASIWTTWQYNLDATRCTISYGISFQNTDMGRQLQPFGRYGFPSGSAHS